VGILLTIIKEINDDINIFSDRYKSIRYIPKLTKKGLESDIGLILELIEDNEGITDWDLANILLNKYKLSKNTAINITPTLKRADLIIKHKKRLKLTNVSKVYLKCRDSAYLGKGFIENYFGVIEMLKLILERQPHNISEVIKEWVMLYELEYGKVEKITSKDYFYKIYKYLCELNYIERNGKYLSINVDKYRKSKEIDIFEGFEYFSRISPMSRTN
jgi:hypothetical protein